MRVTMCCFRVRLSGEGHRGARGREGIVMYKQARPHQKRRKRSGAEVREEGLVAARGLLLDRGPAAVTLANVGQAIGMSHANVLHHFGSAAGLQSALDRKSTRLNSSH